MLDIVSPDLAPALSVPFSLMENGYRRLTNLVKDMTEDELTFLGPAGNINSTATLIAHLTRTDLEYLQCIKGMPVTGELEAEFGPFDGPDGNLPVITGKTVAELLDSYQHVLDMAKQYLMTQTDEDALRPVTVPWWSQPATVRYVLWHMAGHSMFHQGQIRRLRNWYQQRHAN